MKNQTINENLNWPIQTLSGQLLINALLTVGAGLYTVLFWRAELGLNALLFGGFLSGVVWLLHPEYRIAPRLWLLTLGVVLSALAVVWQHSLLAQVAHVVSIFLLLGFAQARELRFLGFALLQCYKIERFEKRKSRQGWQGWNWADQKTQKVL